VASAACTIRRAGEIESPLAPVAALTLYPSAILRLRDHDEREDTLAGLVSDLRFVTSAMAERWTVQSPTRGV
jgi:hypothetical protein